MIILKSNEELGCMRQAGKITALAHENVKKYIKPGVSTEELDMIVYDFIMSKDAYPSFLGYMDYPKSICTSINSQVVHGIPSKEVILKEGDIVGIDIGALHKGYHGDQAKTYPVGEVSTVAKKLIEVTRQSFFEGIKYAKEGYRLVDIGRAIQETVEKNGFSVVKEYTGHGVGQSMHEDPQIPNYVTKYKGPSLKKGMTLAIEPMVNVGGWKVKTLNDGWCVATSDGSLSAHYEHTIAISDLDPIILTAL